jgi:hypothetical protein
MTQRTNFWLHAHYPCHTLTDSIKKFTEEVELDKSDVVQTESYLRFSGENPK